jgi:ABC-type lipoprotein release transport system permease subunit
VARAFTPDVQLPGVVPAVVAGTILVCAACAASLLPAMRAAKVDVVEALRSE